jgi:hypothetical protein
LIIVKKNKRMNEEIEGFSVITLKTNHRDSIVEPILKIYADHRG